MDNPSSNLHRSVWKLVAVSSILLCFSISTNRLNAEIITNTPVADTCLFETNPDNNLGGNADIAAGTTSNGPKSRGLYRFDFTGNIPANATITSVKFLLTVVKQPSVTPPASTFGLHRMLKSWNEGTKTGNTGSTAGAGESTWNNQEHPGNAWSSPGGASGAEFASTASSSTLISSTKSYTFDSTPALVTDVQGWVANPQSNFGWMLITQLEGTSKTARRFATRENATSSRVPKLIVEFTAGPVAVAPTITAHPQNQTVNAASSVSFSVTATSTEPLTYQWQKNGQDVANGPNITGATTATLQLANVTKADEGTYKVIVRNAAGETETQAATLVVNEPPPATDLSITVTAAPNPVTVGSNLVYTVTFRNNGGPATNVHVTNQLPASVVFVSAEVVDEGKFAFTPPVHSAGRVTTLISDLPADGSGVMNITVRPSAAGVITNLATIAGENADNIMDNNAASAVTTVTETGCSLVVVNTNDSGPGSLRAAIECASSTEGLNTITFNIAGAGVHRISLQSALQAITDPVVIDGFTQPGSRTNSLASADNAVRLIELDGSNAGQGANGLVIVGGNSVVRGLIIQSFRAGSVDTARVRPQDALSEILAGGAAIVIESRDNIIEGNFLGAVATGGVPGDIRRAGNEGHAVVVTSTSVGGESQSRIEPQAVAVGSANNRIGGTSPGSRNIISGNQRSGVLLFGEDTTGNLIQGNFIGTDTTGTAALPNLGAGVDIDGANNNFVGGLASGAGNVIAFNGDNGVYVGAATRRSLGNAILGNSIFSNTPLGIDLGDDGVTQNDAGDEDEGDNHLQNFPLLTAATIGDFGSRIEGTLSAKANTAFIVEFFANAACDPSTNGEGQVFIGRTNIVTSATGLATFSFAPPLSLVAGQFITATATDPENNTSEFSPCVLVTGSVTYFSDASIEVSDSPDPAVVGQQLTYTITVTAGGEAPGGPPDLVGAIVTNFLPASVTFVSASGGATPVDGVLLFANLNIAGGQSANLIVTVVPNNAGSITNRAVVSETGPNVDNNSATATTTVNPAEVSLADLAVTIKDEPDPVFVGSQITYTITVTNQGPAVATSVTLTERGNPISLGSLSVGGTTNLVITVQATTPGELANTVSVTAAEADPNPANNTATATTTVNPPPTVEVQILSPVTLNRQTGLFEQSIRFNNLSESTINAIRIPIRNLPNDVAVYNASGTANGVAFVQYDLPVGPAGSVDFLIEFYRASRQPIASPNYASEVVAPAPPPEPGSPPLTLDIRSLQLIDGRFLIEFPSQPGRAYVAQYRDGIDEAWKTAGPAITAAGTRVQWLDDGPPKTESKPTALGGRFYRVVRLP